MAGGLAWAGCESESIVANPASPIAMGGAANAGGAGGATTQGGDSSGNNGDGGGDGGDSGDENSASSGNSVGGAGARGGEAGASGEGGDVTPAAALDSLVVEGVAIGLKPAFDPETTRYSVLASDPAGELSVVVTAESGVHIEIQGKPAISGERVKLARVTPGSGVVIDVANDDGDHQQYRVVYLPADFPNYQVGVHEPSASDDPLYLTARNRSAYYAVKLNNDGVPLFYRRTAEPCHDFKKHPTGHVSYAEFKSDTTLAEHIVLDETYTEVDRVTTVGLVDTDEHDFVIQPNGNYIVLAYERVTRDLTEFGRGSAETILDGIWQELSPDHELLFQWNSWDHMAFAESVYMEKNPRDYSHMNSVFVDDDGNWIVSSRGMAQVLKIDRNTGDVIWRLGGVQNDFTFVNDPYEGLCGQHTASILDNGHLLLFDNGQHCYPEMPERIEHTRVVEYAIDEAAMTAELVWSYSREGTYTESQGSAQRLANGNTLIGWGLGTELTATEVTPDKEIVFELRASNVSGKTTSYRAWRFAD